MKIKEGPLKQQIINDIEKYNNLPEWLKVYKNDE